MSQVSSFERKRMGHLTSIWLWTRAFWESCFPPPGTVLWYVLPGSDGSSYLGSLSWQLSIQWLYKKKKKKKVTACTSGTAIRHEAVVEFFLSESSQKQVGPARKEVLAQISADSGRHRLMWRWHWESDSQLADLGERSYQNDLGGRGEHKERKGQ